MQHARMNWTKQNELKQQTGWNMFKRLVYGSRDNKGNLAELSRDFVKVGMV